MKQANFGQTKLLGTQWNLVDRKLTDDNAVKRTLNKHTIQQETNKLQTISVNQLNNIDNNSNTADTEFDKSIHMKQRTASQSFTKFVDTNGLEVIYKSEKQRQIDACAEALLQSRRKLLTQHVNNLEITAQYKQFIASQQSNT